jgi:hypothetical protein
VLDRIEKQLIDKVNTPKDFIENHFELLNVLIKLRMVENPSYSKLCNIIEALYGNSLE